MQSASKLPNSSNKSLDSEFISLAYTNPETFIILLKNASVDEISQLITTSTPLYPTYLHFLSSKTQYRPILEEILKKALQQQTLKDIINNAFVLQNKHGQTPLHLIFKIHPSLVATTIELTTSDILNRILLLQDKINKRTVLDAFFSGIHNSYKQNFVLTDLLKKVNALTLRQAFLKTNKNKDTILIWLVRIADIDNFSLFLSKIESGAIRQALSLANDDAQTALTLAIRSNQSDKLLQLVTLASREQIDAELKKGALLRIIQHHNSAVFQAIINKASADVVFKYFRIPEIKAAAPKLDYPAFVALISKDPFKFSQVLTLSEEAYSADYYDYFYYEVAKEIPKLLNSPEIKNLIKEIYNIFVQAQVLPLAEFLQIIKVIIPAYHNQITHPKKWLSILKPQLKNFNQTSKDRNQLLALIGRVHFSQHNKNTNNKVLAEEAWLGITSPADLSLNENALIGDYFRSIVDKTKDPTKKILLKSKSIAHLYHSSHQEYAQQKETNTAILMNAMQGGLDSDKWVDLDAKQVDSAALEELKDLNRQRKASYEQQFKDHIAEFDRYLQKREKETWHRFGFFGYSEDDYKLRKSIYAGFMQANTYNKKEKILQNALLHPRITSGFRHQCADIIRKILKDLTGLQEAELAIPEEAKALSLDQASIKI